MKNPKFSARRLLINQANTEMVVMISIASFVTIFSLVASKALLGQRAYQNRIITQKELAVKQLKSNVKAVDSLVNAYTVFVSNPTNIIGGSSSGKGDRDGDNAKIVLDALPSRYDFPALATSLEKILTTQNYKIQTITGSDDELNQQKSASSSTVVPVDMPFQISVSGNYTSVQQLVATLQNSIRPFQIKTLSISGKDSDITLTVSAKTFYQPEKSLTINMKVIK